MKTVRAVRYLFQQALKDMYDNREVAAICSLCMHHATNKDKAFFNAFPDTLLVETHQEMLAKMLFRLKSGEPVQYILEQVTFYGLVLAVNPTVLIPRGETEELVRWIVDTIQQNRRKKVRILDIGTGSGCIAIALKRQLTHSTISAIDVSEAALLVAKKNAWLHQTSITFIQQDILQEAPPSMQAEKFDLIIANPPYLTSYDRMQMHRNILDFEPPKALFVPDGQPLIFYSKIIDFATEYLQKKGLLFFEINERFGQEVACLVPKKYFTDVVLKKDLSGRDRMIRAVFQG